MKDILATYVRTSLEDRDKSHQLVPQSQSIVHQQSLIQLYVAQHPELSGLTPVTYIDDGFTGTNTNRPRFQDLLRDVQEGRVAAVIVKDLSRLGRSYLEAGNYLERVFPAAGVRVIAINDHYDSAELIGQTGGLDVAFRNFIYDSYSKDLSVKVRTAMHTRMARGKFVNHTPYGYAKSPDDKHQMIPDPETAPIVREIFTSILAGMTTSQVAKALNDRHVPTPLQYKQHKLKPACQGRTLLWNHVMVLNILHNIKYTGVMVNHIRESRFLRDTSQRRTAPEEWIVTENAHPPIVSKEEFQLADSKIHRRSKPLDRSRGGGSDAVFYCGHCGRKLEKTTGNDAYFSCPTHRYQTDAACGKLRWSKGELEDILVSLYETQLTLLDRQLAQLQTTPASAHTSAFVRQMAQLERDIDACDQKKMSLFEDYHDNKLDLDAFLAQRQALSQRQAKLRADCAELEAQHRSEMAALEQQQRKAGQIASHLTAAGLPREEMLLRMYQDIEQVLLRDDHSLEVRWRFADLFADILSKQKTA